MKIIFFLLLLIGCTPRASNEMEELTEDVLKAKQGIKITVEPIEKKKSS